VNKKLKKKILCLEQAFVFEDGDEREDAGEEGGEQRKRILFFFFLSLFSLGQGGG
jgi:hypothetical protein